MGPRLLTSRVAGIAGIIFVVAAAVPGFATGAPPSPTDNAAAWAKYYTDHRDALMASQMIGLFGTLFAFFFFAKVIASLRAEDGGGGLSVVAMIAIAMTATIAAIGGVLASAATFRLGTNEHLDATSIEALSDASAITFTMIGVPLAAYLGSQGLLMRAAARVPGWLAMLWLVAAIVELIGPVALVGSVTSQFSPIGAAPLLLGLVPMAVAVLVTSIVMLARPAIFDGADETAAAAGAVAAPAGAAG